MRIAICDDDEKDLMTLLDAVRDFDAILGAAVCAFSSAADLLSCQESFDIVILDIEMPPPNGYEAAKKLAETDPAPVILFLTNSMAYTIRGYGLAFRYLTKPIDPVSFNHALSDAVREANANRFVFCLDGACHVIPLDDIYYFEVFNHHTILHTMDKSYTFRATLKEITAQLPKIYFGTPHQSYIVNFRHIKTATARDIHLTNGAVIPISRRKQQEFDEQLRRFLRR